LYLKNVALIDINADIVKSIATIVPLLVIPEAIERPEISQDTNNRKIIIDKALDLVSFKERPNVIKTIEVIIGSKKISGICFMKKENMNKISTDNVAQKIKVLQKLFIVFSADSLSLIS
jgi:hypothetical protein